MKDFVIIILQEKIETPNALRVDQMCCYIPFSCVSKRLQTPFVETDVNLALPYCETPQFFGSSDNIVEFAAFIMNERNITMPRTPHQAKRAFYNSTSKL